MPFTKKVPRTPVIQTAINTLALNTIARNARNNGTVVGTHTAYVDSDFANPQPASLGIPGYLNSNPGAVLQVLDPDPLTVLGFSTVTTAAQAKTLANALRPLIIAHLADGVYSHLSVDSTSAAITAPLAADAGVATNIGTGTAGVRYTAALSGVTVQHSADGVTQALSIQVNGKAINAKLAGTGTPVNFGTGNAGIAVKANQTGVTLALVDPGANQSTTTIAVVAKAITATLKYSGAITETATGLAAALAGNTAAMALIETITQLGDGSGTSVAAASTALTWAQTSTANDVRLAVLAKAEAMALLSAVINTSGVGGGTVLNAAATALPVNATASTSALLNQQKATVNTHFARAVEHIALPATAQNIATADGTDDATNVALADALMKAWVKHTTQAVYTLEDDVRSP